MRAKRKDSGAESVNSKKSDGAGTDTRLPLPVLEAGRPVERKRSKSSLHYSTDGKKVDLRTDKKGKKSKGEKKRRSNTLSTPSSPNSAPTTSVDDCSSPEARSEPCSKAETQDGGLRGSFFDAPKDTARRRYFRPNHELMDRTDTVSCPSSPLATEMSSEEGDDRDRDGEDFSKSSATSRRVESTATTFISPKDESSVGAWVTGLLEGTWLDAVDHSSWDMVILGSTKRTYRANEMIQYQGTPSKSFYFVLSGSISLSFLEAHSAKTRTFTLWEGKGPCFGALETLMTGEEWGQSVASLFAKTPVTLFEIERSHLARMLMSFPGKMLPIARAALQQLTRAFLKLEMAGAHSQDDSREEEFAEETTLRRMPCSTRLKLWDAEGTLFVTNSYLHFRYRTLGARRTLSHNVRLLEDLCVRNDTVSFMAGTKPREYRFASANMAKKVYDLVHALQLATTTKNVLEKEHEVVGRGEEPILNDRDMQDILVGSKKREYKAGETLMTHDGHNRVLVQICHGSCSVRDKKGNVLRTLKTGDLVGDIAFILDTPSSATVVADEETLVFEIPFVFLHNLFNVYPALGIRLILSFTRTNLNRIYRWLNFQLSHAHKAEKLEKARK